MQRILRSICITFALAGLSVPAVEIGRDDFESGALRKPLWIDKAWCEVVDGHGVGGGKAARFFFKGSPDPKKDAWAELRFDLGELRTEVWFAYALFIPQNYRMKRSANNKFFRIWGREYGDADKLGASMWGRQPFDGFARLKGDWDSTGGGMGEAGKGCDGFITAADLGAWMRIMVHIKAATAEAKGTMRIWKNGVLVIDNDGTVNSWKEQGVHAYRYGYLLGAANSGFTEDTYLFIDDVVFGTTRADVDIAAHPPGGQAQPSR